MQRIVVITGAPAVGKTTVSQALLYRLRNSAWVDGIHVLQVNPGRTDEFTVNLVNTNMKMLVRNYLDAGYSYVIVSWIMHRQHLLDEFMEAFSESGVAFSVYNLFCDEKTLRERHRKDQFRPCFSQLSLDCLEDSKSTDCRQIDTTGMRADQVVEELMARIHSDEVGGAADVVKQYRAGRQGVMGALRKLFYA